MNDERRRALLVLLYEVETDIRGEAFDDVGLDLQSTGPDLEDLSSFQAYKSRYGTPSECLGDDDLTHLTRLADTIIALFDAPSAKQARAMPITVELDTSEAAAQLVDLEERLDRLTEAAARVGAAMVRAEKLVEHNSLERWSKAQAESNGGKP